MPGDTSASVRNQSLAAPQCQTPLPWVFPLQSGCLTIPPQHSWEASKLCLAQGPFLPQGKQEILLGEGTSSIQG